MTSLPFSYRVISRSECLASRDYSLRSKMGCRFSKPVPKPPEPTLPRSTSRAVKCEPPGDAGKVESKRDSTECRAFRKCFSVLADGITDPGRLAVQLYSRELIGPDIRTEAQKQAIAERVKIEMLLTAVEDQIVASPTTKFREFLDVLQNEPSLQHLATRLENSQHELSGLCTPWSVPPPTSTLFSSPLTTCIQTSPLLRVPSPSPQPPPNSHLALLSAEPPKTKPQHPLEHAVQPSDFQHDHQTPLLQYASYLKSVYTQEKLPVYDKWPHVKSKKYINLALIEKEDITKSEVNQFTRATVHGNIEDTKKSKRAMDMGQIAQLPDGSKLKCILVEGAPGVGKSTFAWKLCSKWGEEELLQQYQLVVLLRLRDKSMQTAKNISDLFRYHDHQIQQAAVEAIQRTGGKGVLLLFEGYDELPEELRSESSVFLDVITGRELPEATVLITSRPWASEFLHRECKENISQHIEILGFTKANIESYLESTLPGDPLLLAGLKKYISCYPHINSLMYIPLNSAIVVEVYRNSRKDETLVPKTMTELYSSLVRSLLLRHLLDHPVHGKNRRWRVRSFNDLPQDVYQQLCELGRIAYEGILDGQQVIFSDLPEDFETLGLMQCSPELYADEGTAVSYNFLHLTVQEYLAAFHLSQQPVDKQIEHFREYQEDKRQYHKQHHFHMVLQFLSGVQKFSGYPSEVLNMLCVNEYVVSHDDSSSDESSDEESGNDSHVGREVNFNTLHWLFEAQDNNVIAEFLGSSDIQIKEDSQITPFDCFVLGYCASHSNCTWKIALYDIGDEEVEMLVRGAVEEETCCTGGISKIDLRKNITSEGVKHLLQFPKQFMKKLELLYLDLDDNKFDTESCETLAHFIPHVPHLKTLFLSDNHSIGQALPLIASLTAHNSLQELFLGVTESGVEDCQALSELLSSSTSLKRLFIANPLSPERVEPIINGLRHNNTLERLIVMLSHFSLQNTVSLASVLRTNHTLVYLSLVDCDIDSNGACQLASALCTNDTLQKLILERNPIGVEGATAFAEMLLKNKSLKQLNLMDDSIGEEGAQKLQASLTHNTTIKKLHLPVKYKSSFASSRVYSKTEFCVIL